MTDSKITGQSSNTTKSFLISSILSEERKPPEENDNSEDTPAIVSKIEQPNVALLHGEYGSPVSPKENPCLGGGHIPRWYHWYASQQYLHQLQQEQLSRKYLFTTNLTLIILFLFT